MNSNLRTLTNKVVALEMTFPKPYCKFELAIFDPFLGRFNSWKLNHEFDFLTFFGAITCASNI
jgi:hypothetical protein